MRELDSSTQGTIAALRAVDPDNLSVRPSDLESHARDEGWIRGLLPAAVYSPGSREDAAQAVRICADQGSAIIPFGAGSSIEGQILPVGDAVSFDMRRMNAVIAVEPENGICTVQPGVTRLQLNIHLRDTGMFFPIDPGADATLGGMASTRASGTNAVRYGTMKENVCALELVLADGEVMRTGARTKKSAAGLDLTSLFVGAEGTLGLITELTLRIHPIPEATSTAVASFPNLDAAISTAVAVMRSGIAVGRVEFIDETYAEALRRFENIELPNAPMLFFEFSGAAATVQQDSAYAAELAREFEAIQVNHTDNPEERAALWRARHRAYWAGLKLRPGARALVTDVCVPLSRLVESVTAARDDFNASGLTAPMLGHVGDGNFHAAILIDPEDEREVAAAGDAHARLVHRALLAGGTCTGEHGIGLGKRTYLQQEHGRGVDVMRSIKRALDPRNLFNPGKML